MIFVTVGTQLPFPRLLGMVADAVAPEQLGAVFAQTADPRYDGPLTSNPFLDRGEFEDRYASASLIIGHAGTGTIFAARKFTKPLIVVPRRFELGEHRNDHQFATASQLRVLREGTVCETTEALAAAIAAPPAPSVRRDSREKERLITSLGKMIDKALARG